MNRVNMMSWNCQSVKPKIIEFSHYLSLHNIHIALLSETWLKPSTKFHIPGYECYRNDRSSVSNNPHGGVAILVQNGIKHSLVKFRNTHFIESIFIELFSSNNITNLICGSIYAPPSVSLTEFKSDLGHLLSSPGPVLISGDFNAKHSKWNNISNNAKGKVVVDLCDHNSFHIFAPNAPTLIPCRGSPSIVDFSIAKGISISSPIVHNDLSSDHFPVFFTIDCDIISNIPQFPNYKAANWKKFREHINNSVRDFNSNVVDSIESIDTRISYLTEKIHEAAKLHIPLKNISTFRYNYSPELGDLCRERNFVRRKYQQSRDFNDKFHLNKLNCRIRVLSGEILSKQWNDKISKLSHKDHSIFTMTRALKKRKYALPPFKDSNGELIYDNSEKANSLSDVFQTAHQLTYNNTSIYDNEVASSIEAVKNEEIQVNEDDLFKVDDLIPIIKKLKPRKSAGDDGITNLHVKNLPFSALMFIISIFNSCLKASYFPNSWKLGKIVAIPKPHKDPSSPMSYRPITLLSLLGKLFEKLTLQKLLKFETINSILIPEQFGFRNFHSTTHQVMKIVEKVSSDFNKDLSTGMIQLDLERAFDTVWHDGLIHKLFKLQFPIHLIMLIYSFLKNRFAYVSVTGIKSNIFSILAGVPQGSILSPFLFTIFINDIPKPPNCFLTIFADDTNFSTTGGRNDIKKIITTLQNGFKIIFNFCNDWKFKLNIPKTIVTLFTHSRIMTRDKDRELVTLNGERFHWNNYTTLLGVGLDSKLLFSKLIDENISKAKKALVPIYPLLKKYSSINIETKRNLYCSFIRSILTYSCPVWNNCAKTHILKLQRFQNKCLRMVQSAPFSTRITKLHGDSGIPYISDFIQKISNKFYQKILFSENTLINTIGNYDHLNNIRIKHKMPKKNQ